MVVLCAEVRSQDSWVVNDDRPGHFPDPDEVDLDDYLTGSYAQYDAAHGPGHSSRPSLGQRAQTRNPGDGRDFIRSGNYSERTGGARGFGRADHLWQDLDSRHIPNSMLSGPASTRPINFSNLITLGTGRARHEPGSPATEDNESQLASWTHFAGRPFNHDAYTDGHVVPDIGAQDFRLDFVPDFNQRTTNLQLNSVLNHQSSDQNRSPAIESIARILTIGTPKFRRGSDGICEADTAAAKKAARRRVAGSRVQ
ncbi:uncharacterized protein B0I36DRAFT_350549 [Microdochium trichocladiopsis]|uniref:Uncharacterized protein n=1 Tax=Microdochium trichocladiopsis TaxID=1682393 RepID=A0A9P9BML0_9PEZI|nr:uncharacterized protein B0I36DRAFT_350549 [Microdochium trichocladiopsis]KAH7029723.1 hypothetical protein B0I36DRAFT_350549 [Microdochium trichocladiopsis]